MPSAWQGYRARSQRVLCAPFGRRWALGVPPRGFSSALRFRTSLLRFCAWPVLRLASRRRRERSRRKRRFERSLPEMLEVVSLGLRSGLSFERSFELYYRHFDGMLSQAAEAAHRRWTMGFATREQALRDMAATYDSKLLARLVESVVRSLRFGSSLADGLDALAAEAREVRKTRLQEAIAKAPVKMMLPTGTLILPAMLLLVLGPVLLELMEGF